MRRSVFSAWIATLALSGLLIGSARADNYPSHPITVIVPFAAGGPSDAMMRILGERMRTTLGEAILIENVTGAGGSIGVGRAVRSPADGYTISFGHLALMSPTARCTSSAMILSPISIRWCCCQAIP